MKLSLSKEAVLEAMAAFDRELRGTALWEGWKENKTHKYAIDNGGQLYPVKKIASIASGVPVGDFSGGRHSGQANQLIERAHFKIVDLHPTNPDWLRDELILALNVYLRHRPNPPGKDSADIVALSSLLNRLGGKLFSVNERSETFRNANGVYMKLMNFRRLDPWYTAEGRTGLVRGAKAEEEVWAEFAGDPERCRQVADAIVAALNDPQTETAWIDPNIDEGIEEAPEGRLLTRKHIARERNRKLVESKLKRVLKQYGILGSVPT